MPETAGLAELFSLGLLQQVLEQLGLWEVGRIGVTVSRQWARCVHDVFGWQLAAAGRDVRVVGLGAAHPHAFLNGSLCRAIEPSDELERAELLESGCVKLRSLRQRGQMHECAELLGHVPGATIGSSARSACSNASRISSEDCFDHGGATSPNDQTGSPWKIPLANLRFETPVCAPMLDAKVRAEVTQQHRGKTLTKAGHLKSMTVVALQPCLPFVCHRCGARPEDVSPAHPDGKPGPGRRKWWQALRNSSELECIECLILAAVEAGLDTNDDIGMFQWQRCVGVMEFFGGGGLAHKQHKAPGSGQGHVESDDDDAALWPEGLGMVS